MAQFKMMGFSAAPTSRETPAASETAAPAREPSAVPVAGVVVADADPVLRRSLTELLQRSAYRVLAQADTTEEVVPLVRKLHPEVTVLGKTGSEANLLETVRTLRMNGLTSVVLLAPIPNLEWIRAVRAAGVDMLLARPPREADLVAAVEMTLERRHQERRLRAELSSVRERLDTVSLVQRAKEVLMRRDNISDAEAYQRLRRQAERSGRPLKNIAEAVVLAASVAA